MIAEEKKIIIIICSTRIHRVFGVARPTVSGLLKKLRKKGYIEFQTCEQDDRQKMIQATPLKCTG